MCKLVQGYGINDLKGQGRFKDVDGVTKTHSWFKAWNNMLVRAYDPKYHKQKPTYQNVVVCEEWLTLSVFKEWYEVNQRPHYALDKDLISTSKRYSPETCVFLPKTLNSFLVSSCSARGNLPVGVHKKGNKFVACISVEGKSKQLGSYKEPLEAHKVYVEAKEILAKKLATVYYSDGRICERAYKGLMNWKVKGD